MKKQKMKNTLNISKIIYSRANEKQNIENTKTLKNLYARALEQRNTMKVYKKHIWTHIIKSSWTTTHKNIFNENLYAKAHGEKTLKSHILQK